MALPKPFPWPSFVEDGPKPGENRGQAKRAERREAGASEPEPLCEGRTLAWALWGVNTFVRPVLPAAAGATLAAAR
jgi:hypothetical protein